MVLRPKGPVDAEALAADETPILDLTSWRHLQALPSNIGLVTSLESLCLAGTLRACCCETTLQRLREAGPHQD